MATEGFTVEDKDWARKRWDEGSLTNMHKSGKLALFQKCSMEWREADSSYSLIWYMWRLVDLIVGGRDSSRRHPHP